MSEAEMFSRGRIGRQNAECGLKSLVDRRFGGGRRGRIVVRHRRHGGIDPAEHVTVARGRVGRGDERLKRGLAHVLQGRAGVGAGRPCRQIAQGRLCVGADRAERGLRSRQVRGDKAVAGCQALQKANLLLQRKLIAGLVAELQAKIGVLPGRLLGHRGRERRLSLHDRQHEAVSQSLARHEVRAHRRHAASRRAENMLPTVVNSFADEAYEFSRFSMLVISASRLTPVAFDNAEVAWVTRAV